MIHSISNNKSSGNNNDDDSNTLRNNCKIRNLNKSYGKQNQDVVTATGTKCGQNVWKD